MATKISSADRSGRKSDVRGLFFTFLIGLAVIILFDDLLGWLQNGGIVSVVTALQAASHHSQQIDVDGAGLRTLFVILSLCATTAFYLAGHIDHRQRLSRAIFWILGIGGGFVLDIVYGPDLMGSVFARHGYARCEERDYVRGAGKGRVWIDVYVRNDVGCLAAQETD